MKTLRNLHLLHQKCLPVRHIRLIGLYVMFFKQIAVNVLVVKQLLFYRIKVNNSSIGFEINDRACQNRWPYFKKITMLSNYCQMQRHNNPE